MNVRQRRRGRGSTDDEEDEVLDLIDSCRRYQEERALEHHGSHSPLIRKTSSDEELLHLLDRPVILPSPVVSGDEHSSDDEKDRRGSKHLSSMLADSIGSSLRTFVGAAVPTETKEAILRRSSDDQVSFGQRSGSGRGSSRSSLIANTLETTVIDTVVPPALQSVPEVSREAEHKISSESPPFLVRGSSMLNRLSYSIKRKVQRMTSPGTSEGSPPHSPRSTTTLIDERAGEGTTPMRARQTGTAGASQLASPSHVEPELEGDMADSGVLVLGSSRQRSVRSDRSSIQPSGTQATSDLESSKYSSKHSSTSSKHSSAKSKSKGPSSGGTPDQPTKELSDESFHKLLHSQGLELTDLTESTLV